MWEVSLGIVSFISGVLSIIAFFSSKKSSEKSKELEIQIQKINQKYVDSGKKSNTQGGNHNTQNVQNGNNAQQTINVK